MTSIITVEALSGAGTEGPLSYLLRVDEFHFLLDCGWDENFDMSYINAVKKHKDHIDAVLITYADLPHLGALPYLVGKCGLNCPVYATVPVYKMGQMFMYDWYQSHQNVEEFTLFNLDDVDAAFDKILQLKYTQNVSLKGKGHGLQITPFPAGHMIGGTIWRILKAGEEEILYAVDYNHKKDRHLNGCTFEGFTKPNLMITDAYNAKYQQARRKERDERLLNLILQTVRGGGNVLVVIDTAGRVLELAQLLDQLWHQTEAGLITYSLVLMNNVGYNVVEFAKSMIEWMSDKVLKNFEEGRLNPFEFRHVQICHSLAELRKIRSPMVVLASNPDLESGFSRDLFTEWSANPKNSIILTSRSYPGTVTRKLVESILAQTPQIQITLEVKKRVRLEGQELAEFWQSRRQREQENIRQRLEAQRRLSRMESQDSDDDSSDEEAKPEHLSHPYDLMLKFEHQQKSSFFKETRRLYPMYPFVEEKMKWDEYGEVIRPEDYIIPEQHQGHQRANLNSSGGGGGMDGSVVVLDESGEALNESGDGVPAETEVEIPTKCIKYQQKIDIQAKLAYIDFEGRSDGESIKKLLNQLKPKQLVLIHGTRESTDYLAEHCKGISGVGRIFTPQVDELVDATIESHIYQVTLTDILMGSLEFQKVKDAELAWIDAKVSMRQGYGDVGPGGVKEEEMEEGEQSANPCLDVVPGSEAPFHPAVFVNDPKLSDLKQIFLRAGFHAEFSAGVLYVNNVVAIRRYEAGKYHIEGTACDEYFKIRELLYSQFAIV